MKYVYEDLNYFDKISFLLNLLGEEHSVNIFKNFNEKNQLEITKSFAKNILLDKKDSLKILEEFHSLIQYNSNKTNGGLEYAKRILFSSLDKDIAENIYKKLERELNNNNHFDFLDKMDAEDIFHLIENENNQTIAIIISHLLPEKAGDTLKLFSINKIADISIRIANISDVSPKVITIISEMLRKRTENLNSNKVNIGGVRHTSEILSKLGKKGVDILQNIKNVNNDLYENIKSEMFIFTDIMNIPDESIKIILQEIEMEVLLKSLKGTEEQFKDKIFSFFSKNKQKQMKEDYENFGKMKISEVEKNRKIILDQINDLIENKKIQLNIQEEFIE